MYMYIHVLGPFFKVHKRKGKPIVCGHKNGCGWNLYFQAKEKNWFEISVCILYYVLYMYSPIFLDDFFKKNCILTQKRVYLAYPSPRIDFM